MTKVFYQGVVNKLLEKAASDGYSLISIDRKAGQAILKFHKYAVGDRYNRIRTLKVTDQYIFNKWYKIKGGSK